MKEYPDFTDCYSYMNYLKKLGPLRQLHGALSHEGSGINNIPDSGTKKPVFITGIHRSGSSWIGDIISQADNILYWREPFNPSVVKSMRQQYLYLSSTAQDPFYDNFLKRVFAEKYTGSLFDYTDASQWFGEGGCRHLIKDPTAAFMLEWIATKYDPDIVVVARHPAGFISSILKLNWDFDFNIFLGQERLMHGYLKPYEHIIKTYNYKGMDVEKGAVLWSVIYYVLEQLSLSHDVTWVTYEDICARPKEEFKRLLKAVGLDWNPRIEKKLQKSTSSNITFVDNITTGLERDTERMGKIWEERLSSKEIELIDGMVSKFHIKSYEQYKI